MMSRTVLKRRIILARVTAVVLLTCGLMSAAVAQAGAAGKAPATLLLARDGATEYVIVTGANPSPAEQTAARELAEYLKKVTGAEFRTSTATRGFITSASGSTPPGTRASSYAT